jgi:hypothetical protein
MPKKTSKQTDSVEEVDQKPQVTNKAGTDEEVPKIHCTELDVARLYFRAQEVNEEATQLMCFPKYIYDDNIPLTEENFEKYGKNAIIVTDPIKMIKGGIPKHNPKYHTNDEDSIKRAYFYIPKNKEDQASMDLFDAIQKIDDYMVDEINTKENANKVICILLSKGKGNNKILKRAKLTGVTYTRMITTAKPGDNLVGVVDDDDDEEEDGKKKKGAKNTKDKFGKDKDGKKKEFVPWDRIKVRFSTIYDEKAGPNDKKPINTQIFVGDKEDPEDCTTVSQFEKHFMWNCTAQFALMFNKIWIKKSDKICSISIKCLQIGVTEQPEFKKNVSITKQLNGKLFGKKTASSAKGSSSDDGGDKNDKGKNKSTKAPTKAGKDSGKTKKKSDDDDDDNDKDGDKEDAPASEEDVPADGDEDGDAKDPDEEGSEPEDDPKKKPAKGKSNDVKVKAKNTQKSGSNSSGRAKGKKSAK